MAVPPYYVIGEKETIRVPKLNADHQRILDLQAAGGAFIDIDGGDAAGPSGGTLIDIDGGGA